MNLIALLFAFLRLGIDGEEENVEEKKEEVVEEKTEELEVDVDADLKEEKDDTKSPEADAALAAIRAEKERGDRFERELSEIRGRAPQHRSPADLTADEERVLKDEKATDLQKWQVQANVELRRGRSEAQFAVAQANDIYDRTAFSRIANTNPALFKRYEERVEKALGEMRAKGFNASREQIMDNLIGKDMRDGKFAKKAAPKKPDDASAVPRGKLPGARSDVSGKGATNEHEKRRQRLENVQI